MPRKRISPYLSVISALFLSFCHVSFAATIQDVSHAGSTTKQPVTKNLQGRNVVISQGIATSQGAVNSQGTVTKQNALVLSKKNHSSSKIKWRSCKKPEFDNWFESYVDRGVMQCATITVPLKNEPLINKQLNNQDIKPDDNRSQLPLDPNLNIIVQSPTPPTIIKLALTRIPASGNNKIGTLISVSGGPGQSGLNITPVSSDAYRRLSQQFDIIGYAPRGVYPTTPTIKCGDEARLLHPEDPKAFVKDCWNDTPNDLLIRLGADYAVNDIEAIRQALGEPKINLIGYSYGTKIAALYAQKYPQFLRAGVLDGLVNLNENDTTMRANQQITAQQTFERFVKSCKQTQPNCYFADTKTIAEAEAKMAALFLYFENNKVYDYDDQRISTLNLSWAIYDYLMWPDRWVLLNQLLNQIDNEDFFLLKIILDDAKNNIDFATFASIICADRAPTHAQRATYIDKARQVDAYSTWDNYRKFTDEDMVDACYYWPIAGSDVPHVPKLAPTAPTLLLVAQTNDFATPYINALTMQRYLKAALLTRHSDGHTLAMADTSQCVDSHVVNYLVNPDSLQDYANSNKNKVNLVCKD